MMKLDGVFEWLVVFGLFIGLFLWGSWAMIDYFFVDNSIIVTEPITPKIKIIVNNNVIDTLYIYNR